jgi:FKBP-type peptidyl-prolyl cis-trans isomerase
VPSCRVTMHYSCALETGWRFDETRAFYCPSHASKR